jgi:hypothetical protein
MGRPPTHAEIGKWISDASEALGLFPSVIKSGESWSDTCEDVRSRAREAISRLGETAMLSALSTPAAQPVEGWPVDAQFLLGDVVSTPRAPFWRGTVCGWYRNSEGRLGFNVEAEAIPLAIHNYPQTGLVAAPQQAREGQ